MIGKTISSFHIRKRLGQGGMGVVYEAEDQILGRRVALKVLPDEIADAEAIERFRREARAISNLNHPHICTIYAVDEHEGRPFIVMELIEGFTLRDLLSEGPMTPAQVLDLGAQIADALTAAHIKGVIHRDLKPANIFVTTSGDAKLLDFGLAKMIPRSRNRDEDLATDYVTRPGTTVGTIPYMSPEQARGVDVDSRTDLFSLGVVLYEMATGLRPFNGRTDAELFSALLTVVPIRPSAINPDLPGALDPIVERCLEKNRDLRYQSASDVQRDLKRVRRDIVAKDVDVFTPRREVADGKRQWRLVTLAALCLGIVAAGALIRSKLSPAVEASPPTIAVLPFENLGTTDDEYFADGVADEIRGKLTAVTRLRVIARGSSSPYKKTNKTPQQIATELGARYLLGATIRWDKPKVDRVHVSAELVEIGNSGPPITKWQQRFDAPVGDIFQVQADVSQRVVEALNVAFVSREARELARHPTHNVRAYDAYLRGEDASRAMTASDPASLRRAVVAYENAVGLDPDFSEAWARLSSAYSYLALHGKRTPEAYRKASEAAHRAVSLAPEQAYGLMALSLSDRTIGDLQSALSHQIEALRLSPNNADALLQLSAIEWSLGQYDASLGHLREALRVDPRSLRTLRSLGDRLLTLRRYDESAQVFERALGLEPKDLNTIELRAMVYLSQGDLAGARSFLRDMSRRFEAPAVVSYLSNYNDLVWVLDREQLDLLLGLDATAFDGDRGAWALALAQASALKGNRAAVYTYADVARASYAEQARALPEDPQGHALLGVSLAYLGHKDAAIREALRAVELVPFEKDSGRGAYPAIQLCRVYALVGESERAVDQIGLLLSRPTYLSVGWLRIDPTFIGLRANSRFKRVVSE